MLGGGVVNRVVRPSSVRRHAARSVSTSSTLEYCSKQLELFAAGAGCEAQDMHCLLMEYGGVMQQKSGGAVQKCL